MYSCAGLCGVQRVLNVPGGKWLVDLQPASEHHPQVEGGDPTQPGAPGWQATLICTLLHTAVLHHPMLIGKDALSMLCPVQE